MKYLIVFLFKSFIYIFIFIIATAIGIWQADFSALKDLWEDYKMIYANFMWKTFRINCY